MKRYPRMVRVMTELIEDRGGAGVRDEFIGALAAQLANDAIRGAPMNIDDVSRTNLSRALIWHRGGLEEWTLSDWGVAMAGEAGEVCDAIKKLNRFTAGIHQANARGTSYESHVQSIATEIGDTYLYLDLLAQRLGLRLSDCVRDTFNRVSKREGFDVFL